MDQGRRRGGDGELHPTYSKDTNLRMGGGGGRAGARQAAGGIYRLRIEWPASRRQGGQSSPMQFLRPVPNHVNSLAVKMFTSAEDKNLQPETTQAKSRSLTKEGSTAYQAAAKILGVDPNAPAEYKGLAEPTSREVETSCMLINGAIPGRKGHKRTLTCLLPRCGESARRQCITAAPCCSLPNVCPSQNDGGGATQGYCGTLPPSPPELPQIPPTASEQSPGHCAFRFE